MCPLLLFRLRSFSCALRMLHPSTPARATPTCVCASLQLRTCATFLPAVPARITLVCVGACAHAFVCAYVSVPTRVCLRVRYGGVSNKQTN